MVVAASLESVLGGTKVLTIQQSHTLISDGVKVGYSCQYTFLLSQVSEEVIVRYIGPRSSTEIVITIVEARELYRRLLSRGFIKW